MYFHFNWSDVPETSELGTSMHAVRKVLSWVTVGK